MKRSKLTVQDVEWWQWAAARCNAHLSRRCPGCHGPVGYEYISLGGRAVIGRCEACAHTVYVLCSTGIGTPFIPAFGGSQPTAVMAEVLGGVLSDQTLDAAWGAKDRRVADLSKGRTGRPSLPGGRRIKDSKALKGGGTR